MTRSLSLLSTVVLTVFLIVGCGHSKTPAEASKTFGTQPNLTESVDIATLNAEPANYINKDVLVVGKIVNMCRHSGCWVEIQASDTASIICRSLDESVHFTTDCLGKSVRLQGKLMYDPNAPGEVEKAHEGEAPHACPAPKVLVSLSGAEVSLATSK
ncbi:MAG: hypothetical protein ACOZB3_11085 [Calditrichota bacterium]